jgi:GT2 family glycosyltransferase
MILISIIIPTHNRKFYLEKLLFDIKSQTEISNFQIDIYVVVDGSNDGTLEMLHSEFPNVHIIKGPGDWWITKSLNEGCKIALLTDTDYVVTFNDDIEIPENYFAKLNKILVKVGKDSLIGSLSVTKEEPHLITFSGIREINKLFLHQVPYFPYFQKYNSYNKGIYLSKSLVTRGLIIPIKILKDLHCFDERFPQYGSDEDFCLRAIKKGYEAFISFDLVVYSHYKLTSKGTNYTKPGLIEFVKSFFNKYSVNSISKQIHFYIRHGVPVFLPFFLMIYFLASVKAYLFKYTELQ